MSEFSTAAPPPAVSTERLRERVEEALQALPLPKTPAGLYEPVGYVLEGGGKRLRPVLVLLAADAFGTPVEEAMPAALAVELFHNFTLVHDDIMDHADTRRGRPTVHVRWDESTAVLCGDFLMAMAYEQLAQSRPAVLPDLFATFHHMVARLCEGQTLDKAFETRRDVSTDAYLDMIDRKTGALLEACLLLGACLGEASPTHRKALAVAGRAVGRAFQIRDDLLDLTTDSARWGKAVGGDLVEGKRAFLLLRALEVADGDDAAWLARLVERGGLPPAQVPEARRRMERLGVLDDARRAVDRYTADALAALDALPQRRSVETLRALVGRMADRTH